MYVSLKEKKYETVGAIEGCVCGGGGGSGCEVPERQKHFFL